MIEITKDDKKVKLSIETGMYNSHSAVWLYWDCQNELFADLLAKQLRDKLRARMESIRQQAYNEGWKDKSSKRKKKDYFSGSTKLD